MRVNNKRETRIEEGVGSHIDTAAWRLRVGDLIYVKAGERVPVDMVLLATSNHGGHAYMETASLDGFVDDLISGINAE